MREFLHAPDFQGLNAIQGRRDLYLMAADALQTLLGENRATGEALAATLETLAVAVAQDGEDLSHDEPLEGLAHASQLEEAVATLQPLEPLEGLALASQLGETVAVLPPPETHAVTSQPDRDTEIRLLQEIARLQDELAARGGVDMATGDSALIVSQLQDSIGTLRSENTELSSQVNAMQSANTALNSQVGTLQSTNVTLGSQINALQSTNAVLNSANNDLNSRVNTLQTNLDTQTRVADNLRQEASSLQTANTSLTNQLVQLRLALLNQ